MASLRVPVPADYLLWRDVCSYGYFLLAPNRWHPTLATFTRPLVLSEGPVAVRLRQRGTEREPFARACGEDLRVELSRTLSRPERGELRAQLARMLRLDESESLIAAFHARDPRWKASGRGRLFRSPTLFEDVIKTVTSCNVQWPGTVQMNIRLCEVAGDAAPEGSRRAAAHARQAAASSRPAADKPGARVPPVRAFPRAGRLSRVRPSMLRARCRVGYRDERIVALAKLFATGAIHELRLEDPSLNDDEVFARLKELPGVGPYAAANIMQLLGRYARLPLDTESVRHGKNILGFTGSSRRIMDLVDEHFAPFGDQAFRSYWFELWEFYESKRGPSWTWERDETGSFFTAAQLKPQTGNPSSARA
ncbi:MAG: hypothetical protein SFZ23_14765 [Planctomycetota bacterium]|nr:hypothetical protein [Planctomycetota bacterium]